MMENKELSLKEQYESETGEDWENSQGEPDVDYVAWLEKRAALVPSVVGREEMGLAFDLAYLEMAKALENKSVSDTVATQLKCRAGLYAAHALQLRAAPVPVVPSDIVVVEKDGDSWCAHFLDFKNLQESMSAFGITKESAIQALLTERMETGVKS